MFEKKIDVTALGELLIDFTPYGISNTGRRLFEQNPGGAPANMLAAVSKTGLITTFIGKDGNDIHDQFLKDTIESVGIDTQGLVVDDSVFTTLAFVELNDDGERSFSFARKPGADTNLWFKEVNTEILMNTRVFHVGSLSLTDEPARTTTFEAVKTAKEAGAIISYDPNYRAPLWESRETAIERMRSMLSYVDIIKISDEETDLLTQYRDPKEAAEYLLKKGIKIVAITLGAGGVLICNGAGMQLVPGIKTKVVDTTGAGDSFWGGFVSQMILSRIEPEYLTIENLVEFARYGNAVASICVERKGGISAIPEQSEALERLAGVMCNVMC